MENTELKLNVSFLLCQYGGSKCKPHTMCHYAHTVFQIQPHSADTSLDMWELMWLYSYLLPQPCNVINCKSIEIMYTYVSLLQAFIPMAGA